MISISVRMYCMGRLPKRRMGIILGYIGTAYHGMQYNEGVRTIEGEVFRALCASGCISPSNSDDIGKNSLSRATRTDKGVHALANLLTLKMQRYNEDLESLTREVNRQLPDQIRIWRFLPVKKKFTSRIMTSTRHYRYMLPTQLLSLDRNFIYDREHQERYARLWKLFEGTHNFHNFTIGKSSIHGSSSRFIKSIDISSPYFLNNTQWITISFHGQSFLLHQIRKMVHFTVQTMRTANSASQLLFEQATSDNKIHIPLAPATNLYLKYPTFEGYNAQINSLGLKVPELNFDSLDLKPFEESIQSVMAHTDFTPYQTFLEELNGPN
ncbi:tRNA pseudouridine synthase 1 [Nakaseomyces bracarensis]|uniref:tRNA pseudouridine synthase 1 n=1 Tax=Nakaseomyces bracarensis TaxID=273131 RepID=A0ABR4NM74_9SACH